MVSAPQLQQPIAVNLLDHMAIPVIIGKEHNCNDAKEHESHGIMQAGELSGKTRVISLIGRNRAECAVRAINSIIHAPCGVNRGVGGGNCGGRAWAPKNK
jgi:hypothetical protein